MTIDSLEANLVDPFTGHARPARLTVQNGKIAAVDPAAGPFATYILPGFVDAHVHIESSMLVPSEFARLAAVHGTVATVSDPHEIANVLGVSGVHYMVDNARQVPLKFHFGAPSCVPATAFETAGAAVTPEEVETLLSSGACHYLSEVMNFPGVLAGDPAVVAKLAAARRLGKPIDGHAPGLRGDACARYFSAAHGITTDHECTRLDEALEKIAAGAHVQIREGSAAKNYEALAPLLHSHPRRVMFCSDDKHPDDLLLGHINAVATRALRAGVPLANVLRAACVNAVEHYRLPVGLLRPGDPADFIVTDSLADFTAPHILETVIAGAVVARRGQCLFPRVAAAEPNAFSAPLCAPQDFHIPAAGRDLRVIWAEDGQLITRVRHETAARLNGHAVADLSRDILKIAVLSRYPGDAPRRPAVGFIHGFGLRRGAIASSVAHDSHNIVAVGATDEDLARAVNLVRHNRGGLAVVAGDLAESLPLPVAGLMTTGRGEDVAARYGVLQAMAKNVLGSTLTAPFMTLSFMALLVIPELKLSDRGLFDGARFAFTSPFL